MEEQRHVPPAISAIASVRAGGRRFNGPWPLAPKIPARRWTYAWPRCPTPRRRWRSCAEPNRPLYFSPSAGPLGIVFADDKDGLTTKSKTYIPFPKNYILFRNERCAGFGVRIHIRHHVTCPCPGLPGSGQRYSIWMRLERRTCLYRRRFPCWR